jgi:hypothetical protein
MSADLKVRQEEEWIALYKQIRQLLQQFGEEDDGGKRKDYLLVDDNLGLWQHKVETSDLRMVKPAVVKSLQKLLLGYQNWEIVIGVGNPESGGKWPKMGLVIRDDEIIDGLQRQYFPNEFQSIEYEGSRPHGLRFGDIMYSEGFSNPEVK